MLLIGPLDFKTDVEVSYSVKSSEMFPLIIEKNETTVI